MIGFVTAKIGGVTYYGCYFSPNRPIEEFNMYRVRGISRASETRKTVQNQYIYTKSLRVDVCGFCAINSRTSLTHSAVVIVSGLPVLGLS